MKIWKSYCAVTNFGYRLICNVILPLLIGAVGLYINLRQEGYGTFSMLGILTMAEIMGDYFCFGGICGAGCLGMEYLKTAMEGRRFLKNAFWADLFIRPVRIFASVLIMGVPLMGNNDYFWYHMICALLTSIVSVWLLNITRYLNSLASISMINMIIVVLMLIGCVEIWIFGNQMWIYVLMGIVLLFAGFIITGNHMAQKVDLSYYDNRKNKVS